MRKLLSGLAVTAALIFMAASATINAVFLATQARSRLEAQILIGISVATDILKALLPIFMVWALTARRYLFVGAAATGFILFTAFSLLSALGFAASNRGAVSATRAGVTAHADQVARELAASQTALAALPAARPATAIEELIRKLHHDRRWGATRQCTEASGPSGRDLCDAYFALRSELAIAVERFRREERQRDLTLEFARLQAAGAGEDNDAQATLLSTLLDYEEGKIRRSLLVFIALLIEFGSALGLFLATGHSAGAHPSANALLTPVPDQSASEPPAPTAPPRRRIKRPAEVMQLPIIELVNDKNQ